MNKQVNASMRERIKILIEKTSYSVSICDLTDNRVHIRFRQIKSCSGYSLPHQTRMSGNKLTESSNIFIRARCYSKKPVLFVLSIIRLPVLFKQHKIHIMKVSKNLQDKPFNSLNHSNHLTMAMLQNRKYQKSACNRIHFKHLIGFYNVKTEI